MYAPLLTGDGNAELCAKARSRASGGMQLPRPPKPNSRKCRITTTDRREWTRQSEMSAPASPACLAREVTHNQRNSAQSCARLTFYSWAAKGITQKIQNPHPTTDEDHRNYQ